MGLVTGVALCFGSCAENAELVRQYGEALRQGNTAKAERLLRRIDMSSLDKEQQALMLEFSNEGLTTLPSWQGDEFVEMDSVQSEDYMDRGRL